MKLVKLKLKNFRCYRDEIEIDIDDLTCFIGKMIMVNQLF